MNRPARRRIATLVHPGTEVVGAGASMVWLDERGARVWSLEHDPAWAERIQEELRRPDSIQLVEPDREGRHRSARSGQLFDSYPEKLEVRPASSADVVIIDGRCRVECVERLREVVRPGGWLVLDSWGRIDAVGFKPPHERCTTSFFRRP